MNSIRRFLARFSGVSLGTSGLTQTKTGTVSLNNQSTSAGILLDGAGTSLAYLPYVVSATVAGQRFGGSSGITVTVTH